MDFRIVAFTGKAGSGKDTAASALSQYLNYRVIGLADPIRTTASLMGFDPLNRETKEVPVYGEVSYRVFGQQFGDFVKGLLGEDFFVQNLFREIRDSGELGRVYLVTDLRFDYEAEAFKKMGGIVIQIDRPNNPHALKGATAKHLSEMGVSPKHISQTWVNDASSEEEWKKKAVSLFHKLPL